MSTIASGLPFIHLLHSTLDAETQLIITIRDQNGAKISVGGGSQHSSNGQAMRIIQFEPKPDTKEIDLEVIVNRCRTFEFLVAPRSVKRESPTTPP